MGGRGLGRGPDIGDLVARAQGRKRSAVGRTTYGRPSAQRTADHVQRKRRPSRRLSPSGRDTRRATCPRVTLRRPSGKVRHRCPGNLAVKALANRPAVRRTCFTSLNAGRGRTVSAFAVAVTATPEASGGRFTNDDQNGFGAGDGLSRPVCPTADTAG